MKRSSAFIVLTIAVAISGCATKNYVRQDTQPLQAKVNQVADQVGKQGQELDQTRQSVDKNASAISAVDEKLGATDRRATDAQNRANEANQKATQDSEEIAQLRGVISDIDNYKVIGQATVLFSFASATLTNDDKQELDKTFTNTGALKRYFVAVEGHTDNVGTAEYNLALSRRRADSVVQYLAVDRKVPFYQIRTIGLGKEQPSDAANTKEARARNRRVEIKIFSADQPSSGSVSSSSASR
jgi:OOP family OmpA-OmpF porin